MSSISITGKQQVNIALLSARSSPDQSIDLTLLAETILHIPSTSPLPMVDYEFLPRNEYRSNFGSTGLTHAVFACGDEKHRPIIMEQLPSSRSLPFLDQNFRLQRRKIFGQSDALLEKKRAHIASEQKRRQSINEGFEELKQLIPACKTTTDSKAVILKKGTVFADV